MKKGKNNNMTVVVNMETKRNKKKKEKQNDVSIKDLLNISFVDKYLRERIQKDILLGAGILVLSIIISIVASDLTYLEIGAFIGVIMIAYNIYLIIACNTGNICIYQGICISFENTKKIRKSIVIEDDYKEQFIIYIDPSKVKQLKRGSYVKCYAKKNSANMVNENQFTINSYIMVKVVGQPSELVDK